jgi:hypothetical protein
MDYLVILVIDHWEISITLFILLYFSVAFNLNIPGMFSIGVHHWNAYDIYGWNYGLSLNSVIAFLFWPIVYPIVMHEDKIHRREIRKFIDTVDKAQTGGKISREDFKFSKDFMTKLTQIAYFHQITGKDISATPQPPDTAHTGQELE